MSNLYFIIEGFDISIYDSLSTAARSVEAIDVVNDEYVGYDDEGRCLRFEALEERGLFGIAWGSSHVRITVSEEQPTHQEELRTRLTGALTYVDKRSKKGLPYVNPADVLVMSLQELVRIAVDTYGVSQF